MISYSARFWVVNSGLCKRGRLQLRSSSEVIPIGRLVELNSPVVCDPRRNALLQDGNKNDRIDARKLAELLYLRKLHPVYHGGHGLRTLKELVRSYLTITKDLGRVMTRVKAIYRSWSIPCTGKQVYAPHHRDEWLSTISEPGVRRRAEFFYVPEDQTAIDNG
jgi:hypothetical protein